LQENNLRQRNSQYKEFLSALPHKERVMQEIKRKQTVTEGLYLYLLQKREEFAISASSSNVSIYKQIDSATGIGPVEPNKTNFYILSAFLGLLLPIGYISLSEILNEKISTKSDITSRTRLPIIGELGHIPKNKDKRVTLAERDGIGEQFRIIRANLFYLQKNKNKQTYLITSSTMGEGKSFIGSNLASVIAFPGKKVALLEFDIRKPQIAKNLSLSNTKGLTNYLTGQASNLSELFQVVENVPTMHVYTSGPIPSNPADLLLSDRMRSLFEYLKLHYDYIVVDSPPLGLVSDALILNDYSDAVIYVVRQRHTLKKQIDFINEVVKTKKLRNVNLLINDIKTGGKYGTGYGNGLEYNYSYGETKKKSFLKRRKTNA
jgi:capsular exopolysaccharide synthesis family protein